MILRTTRLLAALAFVGALSAEEGMWAPQQLPDIANALKQAGLQLDPVQFADLNRQPLGAVVSLGGCSASFVSSQGLVATNHHCAFGAIQLNSTPERNLMRDGFNAATLADELPSGPNARVLVLDNITDVTTKVLANVTPEMDGLTRQKTIEAAQKALIAAGEQEPGRFCRVYSFLVACSTACSPRSKSKTCAWFSRPPTASALSAVKSTTGCGRAIAATSP